MRNRYSTEEINYVKKYWGKKPCKEIALDLNRKTNSVRSLASKLGITSPPFWTKEDIELLKEKYLNTSPKELEKIFNRKMAYITHKANELGIIKEKHVSWSKEEHQKLKKLYPTTPNKELEKIFDRDAQAIKRYAHKHNFNKKRDSYKDIRPWTKKEEQFLKENFKNFGSKIVAEKLKRPVYSVTNKARRLKITRERGQSELELNFKKILLEFNLDFEEQYKIWKYKVDFYLKNYNLIIETYGDFWHCNPRIYNNPINKMQKIHLDRDPKRINYLKSKGYKVLIVWEYDFYNNLKNVKKQLGVVLNGDI